MEETEEENWDILGENCRGLSMSHMLLPAPTYPSRKPEVLRRENLELDTNLELKAGLILMFLDWFICHVWCLLTKASETF